MINPFSKSTLAIVIGVAIASLAVAVVLTVTSGDPSEHATAGANGYSRSAIGHRALIELLQKLDIPVVVSKTASAEKAAHGLLVIAEPQLGDETLKQIDAMLETAHATLVVLPRRWGYAERGSAWVDESDELPIAEIANVATAAGLDVAADDITRAPARGAWRTQDGWPAPALDAPQLLQDADSAESALVRAGSGILVGPVADAKRDVYVLSDPDLIANFGLRRGANAELAVRLIDRLRAGGPVVFDETVHGFAQPPSLVRVLFSFPIVLATIQVLICALLAMWAAMVRFGPARAAPPPFAPGKDFLIANTAALLRYGGHHAAALRDYLAASIAAVRHALHAPPNLAGGALTDWLERVRAHRGAAVPLAELEHDVTTGSPSPQRVVELADRIYRWRTKMMHGPRSRS